MAFSTTESKGSFVKDIDGNNLLDLSSTNNLALGHNHEALIKMVNAKKWDKAIMNPGLDASHAAHGDFAAEVRSALGPLAPRLLPVVTLVGGRNATEHALMHAFKVRECNASAKVLGFHGANHGHSLAMTQFAHPSVSASGVSWPCLIYPENSAQES